VYVGFLDIGICAEATTRRLHLRAPPDQQVACESDLIDTSLLEHIRSVLSRCLYHVRLLDVHRTGCDRPSDSLSASYDVSLWIGPLIKREEFRRKQQLRGKTTTSCSASDAGIFGVAVAGMSVPVAGAMAGWDHQWQGRSSGSGWQARSEWQQQGRSSGSSRSVPVADYGWQERSESGVQDSGGERHRNLWQ
jgi:hypothetical protein